MNVQFFAPTGSSNPAWRLQYIATTLANPRPRNEKPRSGARLGAQIKPSIDYSAIALIRCDRRETLREAALR